MYPHKVPKMICDERRLNVNGRSTDVREYDGSPPTERKVTKVSQAKNGERQPGSGIPR